MNLSIKQLRAFSALANLRSFTKAARACHLSQPAFSSLIHRLEEDAGSRMFYRNTRRVELTVEGKVFESVAARLLHDFEHAFDELDDLAHRRRGRVSIAALPSIAGGALPPVVAEYRRRYPGIDVVLNDVTADACLESLRAGQVDAVLSAAISGSPDLHSEALLTDNFHLVCRKDHCLAKRRGLKVDDVVDLPMIKFARSSSVRQHVDAAFYPRQAPLLMEVNNLVTAAGLIAHGIGVTLVPTLALFQFQFPELTSVPLSLPIADREICLLLRKEDTPSRAAQAFIDLLREHFLNERAATGP